MSFVTAALLGGAAVASGCDAIVGIPNVTLAAEAGPCDFADGAARRGAPMVLIDAGSSAYCIDTTEVTVGQYNAFLLDGGPASDLPPDCADAAPGPSVDQVSDPKLAVGGTGWCDAWSFCRWANKRLCGTLDDGGYIDNPGEATEWGYACVNGKENYPFPYGASYEAGACNVGDPEGGAVEVAGTPGCHGIDSPYSQIYDMVGNVSEFVNDIHQQTVAVHGGAWLTTNVELDAGGGCQLANGFNGVVFDFGESGIRCCADPN